jgi:hypothetical protein
MDDRPTPPLFLPLRRRRAPVARPRPFHRVHRAGAVVALAAVISSACAAPDAGGRFTVRDSAGVSIAESTAPRWDAAPAERWTIGEAATLDLSATGSGPEHEFYRVADALRLSDGRTVVANSGSYQIRLYSPAGEHLASVGREGEGPAEFQRFFGVDRLPGDSLLVHSYPSRITILSPELELVRTFELDPLARRLQAFEGGILGSLGTAMGEHRGGNALLRMPEHLVRWDLDGGARDTVLAVPGSEAFMFVSELGVSGGVPLFGKRTEVAVGDGAFVVGLADSLAYDVYDPDGSPTRRVRVRGYDLSVSSDEIDRELEARLGTDPDPFSLALHEALPRPRTRAAYETLLVDAGGHVWAGAQPTWTERRERAARDWNVFTPEGEWLGAVTLPGGFTPFEIGVDYVLGARFDEMGVEHVQVLGIQKP